MHGINSSCFKERKNGCQVFHSLDAVNLFFSIAFVLALLLNTKILPEEYSFSSISKFNFFRWI